MCSVSAMTQNRFVIALAALFLCSAAIASAAGPPSFEKGAILTVRANSIWFQDTEKLSRWQELKHAGPAKIFNEYQWNALTHRDAWQLNNPLTVKVIGYDAKHEQVNVELQTPGRLEGSIWFLDARAFEP